MRHCETCRCASQPRQPSVQCKAAEAIHEGARQAGETFRQGYDAVRQSYSDAEEMVRQRPSQAAAICFGVGVLTGLLVAVMFRRS